MAITWPMVLEIRRLLAEGQCSHRRIALQVGVSRGTVLAVAHGKEPRVRSAVMPGKEQQPWPREEAPRRCAQCGQLVHHPCLTCHVRANLKHRPRTTLPASESRSQSVQLDLNPEMRARYEAVRLRLQAQQLLAGDSSESDADSK